MTLRRNIVDVLSSYLDLQSMGNYYVAVCPFHDDHSPSLVVYPNDGENGRWRCMACSEEWGDVVDFVQQIEDCSLEEARKIAEEEASPSVILTKHLLSKQDADIDVIKGNMITLSVALFRVFPKMIPKDFLELKKRVDSLISRRLWTTAHREILKHTNVKL